MHKLLSHKAIPNAKKTTEGYELEWRGTALMGILNVTPDSFSDGGSYNTVELALAQAKAMLAEGALLIDVGGESSRPGAEPVSVVEEIDRVLPVISNLKLENAIISIDTSKAEVATAALKAGAHMVNDVTGLRNAELRQVCAEQGVPVIIMHMQGEPRTMHLNPSYNDVISDIKKYLLEQASLALQAGIPSVMLDPGFGFGKTLKHNLDIIRQFKAFTTTPYPILLGASRKKTIDKLASVPKASERDAGSLVLHLEAARQGAAMLRVHNVALHAQALKVAEALYEQA